MRILHIDLVVIETNTVQVSYFWDAPKQVNTYTISTSQLTAELKRLNYIEDYVKIGQVLYTWLNGKSNNLAKEIARNRREGLVLAINSGQNLAKMAWESLHDGQAFLVSYFPPILPIRWLKGDNKLSSPPQLSQGNLKILVNISSPQGIQPEIDISSLEVKMQAEDIQITNSGSFAELCTTQQAHSFDILHLVGQTTIQNEQAYIITETELGEPDYISAKQLINGLGENLPSLIFLSGCWSGYSSQNSFYLQAAELVHLGIPCVLAWGQPSLTDETATAIMYLYQELGKGRTLIESLALTYQNLLKIQARDWTSLHLYVRDTLPETIGFSNSKIKQEVEPLLTRRSLQKCLKILTTSTESELGILIQSKPSKVRDELTNIFAQKFDHQIIQTRQITVDNLFSKLATIRDESVELKYQLRDILKELTPSILIFKEFEWNLEYKEGKFLLKTEVVEILKALTWAINESSLSHRMLISSCYEFERLRFFYLITKSGEEEVTLQIESNIQTIITQCLIYTIPVPRSALDVVCQSITEYQLRLNEAIKLGYIEITNLEDKLYKVASILTQLRPDIKPNPTEEDYYKLCYQASRELQEVWAKQTNEDEAKWGEIFRLYLADKRTKKRFKEGFMLMLATQYNSQADLAYERELRKCRDELSSEDLLEELETYLKQAQWRKADEETAWIFYQIMIIKRCRGFKELYEQIPCDILLAIDELWLKYSEGKYGFSTQNKIYRSYQSHNEEMWSQFGDSIGWKRAGEWLDYGEMSWGIDSPQGNLPALYSTGAYTGGWGKVNGNLGWGQEWVLARRISSLMNRLVKCNREK